MRKHIHTFLWIFSTVLPHFPQFHIFGINNRYY